MTENQELIIDLAYKVLNNEITIEDLTKYGEGIKETVDDILMDKTDTPEQKKFARLLESKLRKEAIKNSDNFDLDNFLDKPDFEQQFSYECPFNNKTHKAAIGLIFPDKAFYCDVPKGSNHASLVTELHRIDDPNYEDLSIHQLLHPEDDRTWQEIVMSEEKCIIIHFLPNDYGEAIFIPGEITPFQQEELEKINQKLIERNIEADTSIDDKTLTEYLEEIKRKKELSDMFVETEEVIKEEDLKKIA